jgi:tripartite-type tricarboxylate transporter receptor subunit TctC
MLNGAFYSLPYDVLNDFVPISPLVTSPTILLATKTIPPKDLNELIVWLKANPNKVSAGFGAVAYRLLAVSFQKETATQLTLVPYRGGAPRITGPRGGPDRAIIQHAGRAATSAGREYKSICGGK